jgi:uncharacterized protein
MAAETPTPDVSAESPVITDAPAPESKAQVAPAIARHAAPRGRRRWPWIVLGSLAAVLVLAVGGALWYFSGLMGDGSRIPQPDAGFPMSITSVDGDQVSYSGVPSGWTDQGLTAIATEEGGYAQTTDPTVSGGDSGTRRVTTVVLPPEPAVGQAAALDGWYFPRDPRVGLGLEFQDVEYDSPLGPTPAWFIPGTSTTWVVVVHGRSDTPAQGLRIASTVAPLGYPMLLIKYRNDAGAPAGNGYGQWGADEWQDVEAAVQYALDNGAERVVLAGVSMGGSASLALLQNSGLADRVAGLFLDAPMTSFGERVDMTAADMGVPSFFTAMAKQVASWRYGFDWQATDYVADAGTFTTPMLIVQGTEDGTVPVEINQQFAAAADPAVVTLELFEGAGHTTAWNMERARYEALLSDFLTAVAPPS